MATAASNITIENCRLIFRNLTGKEGKFNAEGNRNFGVVIPDELAKALEEDGWPVKYLENKNDPDEAPTPWLKVKCKFGGYMPPKIYMVTKKNKTLLTEDSVCAVDYAEIANVDIVIRPYDWEINGKTGRTAYVKNMYVTVVEDELANKYDFDNGDQGEEEMPWD